MSAAEYPETGLAMRSRVPGTRLYFWGVDEGVLIVTSSLRTRRVVKLTYWLSDGRPKFTAKTFSFSVESFDPQSGRMVLSTKRS